ncbi:Phosphatidylinositol-3-phosphatase SAC1 [Geodia barretti]|uniref:Phosphatidylinositol-3-phosphatase SAC1 n=2 Tax=Geodia barretti TaxID=519541 RepID=A0AA35X556_GEOBA|nr:Phosphatidylinositol-3-phosphatase SAC1 [Geodia barretti]
MKESSGTILSVQQGVFRTNCMDCLDRTNVVQSLLAHRALQDQLQKMNLLGDNEHIEEYKGFEYVFKNVWADNADVCANQYAGTGALKTDFTRTGKRTFLGLLKDGYNSAVRYYYNNFNDGYKQDAIDVFLGNYVVNRMETSSMPDVQRAQKYYLMPTIILVTFSLFFLSLLIPSSLLFHGNCTLRARMGDIRRHIHLCIAFTFGLAHMRVHYRLLA